MIAWPLDSDLTVDLMMFGLVMLRAVHPHLAAHIQITPAEDHQLPRAHAGDELERIIAAT